MIIANRVLVVAGIILRTATAGFFLLPEKRTTAKDDDNDDDVTWRERGDKVSSSEKAAVTYTIIANFNATRVFVNRRKSSFSSNLFDIFTLLYV